MALGLTLPVVFHAVGLGSKFLPMLLPLLLNGFLSPLGWALFTGAVTPLTSALVTGMPPLYPPVAAVMSVECMVLAGVARLVYGLHPAARVAGAGRGGRVQPCNVDRIVMASGATVRPPSKALRSRIAGSRSPRRRAPARGRAAGA